LTASGQLGTVREYFNPERRGQLERRWGCDGSLESFVRAVCGHGTTDAGYLGGKLHWDQLVALRAEVLGIDPSEPEFGIEAGFLERFLPAARYVRVLRRDVNRQAVSYWIAYQTEVWNQPGTKGREPARTARYDFDGIERCRRLIENFELHWDRFFRANGIEPLVVAYEGLVEHREATVRQVVRELRPDAPMRTVGPPTLRRQSGDLNERMLERFARDRQSHPLADPLDLLPGPFPGATGRYRPAGKVGQRK
jgi:LPS sulfotransferase NodH